MRIIAGSHRGRPIRAPSGMRTRPTTDRVREALFSILGDLTDFQVIDCFAGSGAIGLEAVSRGASRAFFVESGREACTVIERNAASLGLSSRCVVLRREVEKATGALLPHAPFDLILADPPWPIAQEAAPWVAELAGQCLAGNGRLVLGHPTREPLSLDPELGFELQQTRHWGDSAMSFFERSAANSL
jgi:16S rRNA (guanine966-N2)-methyltransferase